MVLPGASPCTESRYVPLRNRSPAVERMVPSQVVKVGTARAPDGWNTKVYELHCARESVSGVSEVKAGTPLPGLARKIAQYSSRVRPRLWISAAAFFPT